MVHHPRRRGIQQSADMLRSRSASLKLEKTILITINFTIMCTTRRRRRCGCRRRCPQPRMGRLRQFRRNRSVLWTYLHRLVARLTRRRWGLGRQSEHGQRGGHLGGSTTVDLLLRWAPLDAVAEFGAPTVTIALAWVLLVRGHKGFGREREGGEKKCPQCWCR
jgi:hypothetical protein